MNRKTTTLALMFATLPASVLAQPATGLPPFGSFSGGPFDTVNNSNLNVHFEIPIIGKAGVGLPFAYTLTYDTSVWYPVTSGFVQQWTPVNNWGWNAVTAVAETGYVWYYASPQTCSGYNFNVYSGWQYHDPYGASHYFPGYVLSRSDMPAPCPNSPTTHPMLGSCPKSVIGVEGLSIQGVPVRGVLRSTLMRHPSGAWLGGRRRCQT